MRNITARKIGQSEEKFVRKETGFKLMTYYQFSNNDEIVTIFETLPYRVMCWTRHFDKHYPIG